jgi:hypothetical protein
LAFIATLLVTIFRLIDERKENMKTDWQLIRELMNSVIDACEAIENLHLTESDRNTPLLTGPATVWDALQSSWTYPENVQYDVVRIRHELGNDKHYTPESARALINAAKVGAELIGAGAAQPIRIRNKIGAVVSNSYGSSNHQRYRNKAEVTSRRIRRDCCLSRLTNSATTFYFLIPRMPACELEHYAVVLHLKGAILS